MKFRLNPPDNLDPEAWLVQYDRTPVLLPIWPASDKVALVCVFVTEAGAEYPTEAFVVTSPKALTDAAHPFAPYGVRRLFFCVPRAILFTEGLCPDLTPASFTI